MIGDFVGSEGSSVGADQLAVGLALGKDFKRFQPHGIEGMRAEPVLWIGSCEATSLRKSSSCARLCLLLIHPRAPNLISLQSCAKTRPS